MSSTVRNVLIVVALAVAVYALPGGGTSADIVAALLGIAFSVAIWFFLMRFYRENRSAIYSLGDRHRALLYGALAALLFAGAARLRFWDSSAGSIAWLLLVAAAIYALVVVWRQYRAYD